MRRRRETETQRQTQAHEIRIGKRGHTRAAPMYPPTQCRNHIDGTKPLPIRAFVPDGANFLVDENRREPCPCHVVIKSHLDSSPNPVSGVELHSYNTFQQQTVLPVNGLQPFDGVQELVEFQCPLHGISILEKNHEILEFLPGIVRPDAPEFRFRLRVAAVEMGAFDLDHHDVAFVGHDHEIGIVVQETVDAESGPVLDPVPPLYVVFAMLFWQQSSPIQISHRISSLDDTIHYHPLK